MADMAVTGRDPSSRVLVIIESLTLFVFGIALMTYFYHSSVRNPGDEIGVPGHDSYYHIKMAAMLPQVGILHDLPWLQYSFFRQQGHEFVSHHFGFHVLLMPFVYLSHFLTGDFLAGGRWAAAAFFGINLVLFNLLLRAGNVPYRWGWLVLFLLMPDQFFMRHSLVRAIGASLVFMQLLLLLLFQGRHVWAALVAALYVQLYLGAVMFAPLLVGLYAAALVFGPADDRHFPWRMVAWTAGGWVVGVVTYPYFRGMLEFLTLQVTKTGLAPDIEVGQEWNPYSNTWWVLTMSAVPAVVWAGAVAVRARFGPRLNAKELALLLVNFAFLLLMLKARRFVEYWPPFCLLSAAYLSAPVLAGLPPLIPQPRPGEAARGNWATWPILGLAAACVAFVLWNGAARPDAPALLADWPIWATALALLMLAPLTKVWMSPRAGGRGEVPIWRLAAVLATAAVVFACLAALVELRFGLKNLPAPRLNAQPFLWALAMLYVLAPAAYYLTRRPSDAPQPAPALVQTAAIVLVGLGLFGATLSTGARQFSSVGEQMRCGFDLPAMREAMKFLEQNSAPGDIVFTDDWDIFPPYFYYNTHNYYIVGLDPKFTHARRPDLWERYMRISRGEAPTKSVVKLTGADGQSRQETISVDLKDIRSEFKARFVICDHDHQSFASKLARDRNLAELIYPSKTYAACRNAPFLVFRIRGEDEPPVAVTPAPQADQEGQLYLGSLTPISADQGWGELTSDASVENRRLRLHGTTYRRGIGTHAPSKLLYNAPPGYELFEAVVGVDDETNGRGSVVAAVYLDGTRVFESPALTGGGEPVVVRIPLHGARQILLTADTTADGQRFDHTDWADAKFTHTAGASTSQATQPAANATENPAEESPDSGAP